MITLAFSFITWYIIIRTCRCDGIGRRSGLKIHRWRQRTGSSPVTGTKYKPLKSQWFQGFSLRAARVCANLSFAKNKRACERYERTWCQNCTRNCTRIAHGICPKGTMTNDNRIPECNKLPPPDACPQLGDFCGYAIQGQLLQVSTVPRNVGAGVCAILRSLRPVPRLEPMGACRC